jgi:hypothetical protein
MTPLDRFIGLVRRTLNDPHVTREATDELRRAALDVIDHDLSPDVRQRLRAALDTSEQPDMRSFQTDSGVGRSRAR